MDAASVVLALAIIFGCALGAYIYVQRKGGDHLNWTHPGAKPPPIGMPKMPDDTPPEDPKDTHIILEGAYRAHEAVTFGDLEIRPTEVFVVAFGRIFATGELTVDLAPHRDALRKAQAENRVEFQVDMAHMSDAVNAMVDSVQRLERPMQEMSGAMTSTMNRAMGHLDESMRRMSVNMDRALSGVDRDAPPFSVTTTVRRTTTTTGRDIRYVATRTFRGDDDVTISEGMEIYYDGNFMTIPGQAPVRMTQLRGAVQAGWLVPVGGSREAPSPPPQDMKKDEKKVVKKPPFPSRYDILLDDDHDF
jgi:hypothetical protein